METNNNDAFLANIEEQVISELSNGRFPDLESYIKERPELENEILEVFQCSLLAWNSTNESPEKEPAASVAEHIRASRSTATNLTQRIRELDMSATNLAGSVNLPTEFIVGIQMRYLTDLPDRLVIKLARALRQPARHVKSIVSAVEQAPRKASFYRTEQPTASTNQLRSFEDMLQEFKQKGKLTDSQAEEWLEGAK